MKKVLISLSLIVLLVGCTADNDDNQSETNEEQSVETLDTKYYYDLAIAKLEGDDIGAIEGTYEVGALPGSRTSIDYNGSIWQGELSVTKNTFSYLGETTESEEISFNISKSNKFMQDGISRVYSLDIDSCTISQLTMTCLYDSTVEEEKILDENAYYGTVVNGVNSVFTFKFNEQNELVSIKIQYAGVSNFRKHLDAPANDVLDIVNQFYNSNQKSDFIHDGELLVSGGYFYGEEEIVYY